MKNLKISLNLLLILGIMGLWSCTEDTEEQFVIKDQPTVSLTENEEISFSVFNTYESISLDGEIITNPQQIKTAIAKSYSRFESDDNRLIMHSSEESFMAFLNSDQKFEQLKSLSSETQKLEKVSVATSASISLNDPVQKMVQIVPERETQGAARGGSSFDFDDLLHLDDNHPSRDCYFVYDENWEGRDLVIYSTQLTNPDINNQPFIGDILSSTGVTPNYNTNVDFIGFLVDGYWGNSVDLDVSLSLHVPMDSQDNGVWLIFYEYPNYTGRVSYTYVAPGENFNFYDSPLLQFGHDRNYPGSYFIF